MRAKKVWAFLLTLVMVVTTMFVNVPARVSAADEPSLDVTDLIFEYFDETSGSWKPIAANTELPNEAAVRLNFNWSINNLADTIEADTEVSIPLNLKNITLETKSNIEYRDSDGNIMGSYSISGDTFSLKIYKSYCDNYSNKQGSARLEGNIQVDNGENTDRKDVEIGAFSTNLPIIVTFEQKESYLSIQKDTVGSATKNADGTYTQKFTVTIKCNDDSISDLSLTDTYGQYLSDAKNFVYNGTTYSSLDEVAQAIKAGSTSGTGMDKDQTATFTYEMTVAQEANANNVWDQKKNVIKASYKTNKDNSEEKQDDAYAVFVNPKVEKAGTANSDGTVSWTITIDVGNGSWDDVDFSNISDVLTEYRSNGDVIYTTPLNLDKADFVSTDGGKTYKYTYVYTPSQDAQDYSESEKVRIKNEVKDIKIDEENYGDDAEVSIGEDNWAQKTCVGYNPDTKEITWKISIDVPATGVVRNLQFADDLYQSQYRHSYNIDGGRKITITDAFHNGDVIVDGFTSQDTDVIAYTYGDDNQYSLTFNDDYIARLQQSGNTHIELQLKTVVTEEIIDGKTFINHGSLSYSYNGTTGSITVQAEYRDTTENATYKKAENGGNVQNGIVKYTVWVNLKNLTVSSVAEGDKFTFEDTLPEDLKFKKITFVGAGQVDGWFDTNNAYSSAAVVTDQDTKVTFEVTLTSEMASKLNSESNQNKGVFVTYEAEVRDPVAFKNKGTHQIKNSVKCSYNGNPIGQAVVTHNVTPEDFLSKSMTYTRETAPYINFEIDINPTAGDLNSEGDVLLAEDTMGTALVFEENTLRVVTIDENGTEIPITPSYYYDVYNNKLSFELPDNKHIKIRYSAKLTLYADATTPSNGEELTFENSGNTFSLKGIASTDTSDEYGSAIFAYSSDVEGIGGKDGITLWKYYLDEDTIAHNLGGSGFAIYETTYNSTTNLYEVTNNKIKDAQLSDTEYKWTVENLSLDKVYAVVETNAATGFKINTTPYFFVLRGVNYDDVIKTSQLNTYTNKSYMKYENEMGDNTSLKVTKTFSGDITEAQAKASVTFHIKDEAGTFDRTYNLTDAYQDGTKFVKGSDGVYTLEIMGINPGKYTVEEIITDITGKECVSKYTIDNGAQTEGKKAEVTFVDGDVKTVAFTNEYTDEKTSVTVTKKWEDNNNQDGVRPDSIQVELLKDGIGSNEIITLNENNSWTYTWDNLNKYKNGVIINYTVDEVSVPTGYQKDVSNVTTQEMINETAYLITNTHETEKTNIEVTKVWNHGINTDIPDKAEIKLLADGVVIDTKDATSANNWVVRFTNLPVYRDGGVEIVYTLDETAIDGYETVIGVIDDDGKATITNTFVPEKVSFKVTKKWVDNNNQDGVRPDKITVQLYRKISGQQTGTAFGDPVEVKASDNWEYTWTQLDKVDANNNIYEYYVEETVPDDYVLDGIQYGNYSAEITNSHETAVTDVSVIKKWEDDNNQDGVRPESIQVKLLANGVLKSTIVLSDVNDWKYTWRNLDKYANQQEIEYTVTEVLNSTEYTENIVKSSNGNEFTITNTHVSEVRSIEVQKIWDHGINGVLPTKATINLLADGVIIDTKDATQANNWKVSFDNLPVYKAQGVKIVYTISEKKIDGYNAVISEIDEATGKATITNTYAPETTTYTVIKKWDDNDNQDGKRPTQIIVQLYQQLQGSTTKTEYGNPVTLTEDGQWTYTWNNLPLMASDGTTYVYTVTEKSLTSSGYVLDDLTVEDNIATITNKHTPEEMKVKVHKVWVGDNLATHPDVKVQLYANGVKTGNPITLSESNNFEGEWTNLPVYKSGVEITYSVKEVSVPDGYADTYKELARTTEQDGTVVASFEVTNSYPATERKVVKYWEDDNNQDGVRPNSIDVELFANGVLVPDSRLTLDETNNWSGVWKNLQKNSGNVEIVYTVKEYNVSSDDYVASIVYPTSEEVENGNVTIAITNTRTSELTEIEVEKVWDDNNDQDRKRPASVTVQLYADNRPVQGKTVVLSEDNDWKASFTGLPAYNTGRLIKYSVVEENVTDYSVTYSPQTAYTGKITITNSYTPGLISKSVLKVWDDNNNQDGLRPASIKVQLYKVTANGDVTVGSAVTLNKQNSWKYTWQNLDEMENGTLIEYYVKELEVPSGYDVSYDVNDNTGTTTITNTHEPAVTEIEVVKQWDDNDNAFQSRPDSVIVALYANGQAIEDKTAILSEENDWKARFTNLPAYEQGTAIEYSVVEQRVDGYTVEYVPNKATSGQIKVINSYTPDTTSLSVRKIWDDEDDADGLRTGEVKISLAKVEENSLVAIGDEIILSDDNDWTYTWTNLPKYENGEEIEYSVYETDVPQGYIFELYVDQYGIYNVVNTHVPYGETSVGVRKVWDDDNDAAKARPYYISVILLANGEQASEPIVIDESMGWTYTWEGLPKYDEGVEIEYTVAELEADSFSYIAYIEPDDEGNANINYVITNTYMPLYKAISVKKIWADKNDAKKIRPKSIKVGLYANGELYDEIKLNDKNNWSYTWDDILIEDENGDIEYTIKEMEIPDGYEATIVSDGGTGFIITNSIKPTTPGSPDKPKTGDMARPITIIGLMAICGFSFTLLVFRRRRKTR